MIDIVKTNDKQFSYAKILVMGESASGKTRFLGTVPENEILIINIMSESGLMTLKDKNIDVINVDGYKDMIETIEWIKKNGQKYTYIGIDSLSQWQKGLESEIIAKDKFTLWREIKEKTKQVIDEFKRLPFHVVFTCHVKIDKDEVTGETKFLPDLAGSMKDEIGRYFDEIYYFDRYQQNTNTPIIYRALLQAASKYPCKSRTLGELTKLENPNLAEISKLILGKEVNKTEQFNQLQRVANEISLPKAAEKVAFVSRNELITELEGIMANKNITLKDLLIKHKAKKKYSSLEELDREAIEYLIKAEKVEVK